MAAANRRFVNVLISWQQALQSPLKQPERELTMLQNTSTIDYKHQIFIERVVDLGVVWGLQSDQGFATSVSNNFEDVQVIPFWSDKAYAKAVAKEGWDHYIAKSIPLAEFLENWLVGMRNDGLIVGTNWDPNMFGKEIEPLDLAIEIAGNIVMKGKDLELTKYKNIADFHIQIKRAAGLL